jgi:hypothetical protein
MAIQKQYTTPQGVVTNYHEIVRVEVSAVAECVSVYVNCNSSQTAAQSGSSPVWQECVVLTFNQFATGLLGQYYDAIITEQSSVFDGATDLG